MTELIRDCIVNAAKELGHPTRGEFAHSLWILCSGVHRLTPREARRLYEDCGYKPFSGYPLQRLSERKAA